MMIKAWGLVGYLQLKSEVAICMTKEIKLPTVLIFKDYLLFVGVCS
jgi:hypothetical protein